MLLTCPACGARYEIDGSLIPKAGRRVQCSACEHVWQVDPPQPAAASEAPPAPADARRDDGEAPQDESSAAEAPGEPPRRPIAEDVRAILRSEAEREARVRRERGLVEIQPELSLAPGAERPKRRPRPAAGALPNPDEINATLRAASMRAAQSRRDGSRGKGGSGFVAGLLVGLVLVGVAAIVYLAAPGIGDAVPAAEPTLEAYVTGIDALRDGLHDAASRAAAALSNLLGSGG